MEVESDPVKMLLVGAGFVGKLHFRAAAGLPGVRYIGFVEPDAKIRQAAVQEFGIPGYANLHQALEESRPDAVDLCVPTHFHLSLIKEAAEHGLHILCEKPLTIRSEDAAAISEIISRTGVRLMVAEIIRFWPEYVAALQVVRSGELGELSRIELHRLSASPPFNSWMIQPELGGGAVLDLQVHDFGFLLQLLGSPGSIAPLGAGSPSINDVTNILDYGPDLTVINRASFQMPPSYVFRSTFQLELEGGLIDMDDWRPAGEKLLVFPNDGSCIRPVTAASNPFRDELAYFCSQLQNGRDFDLVPLSESLLGLHMCLASWRAHTSGVPVKIETGHHDAA
jgi:UDP-N-acetylglucosamine 3-dehydrogenase